MNKEVHFLEEDCFDMACETNQYCYKNSLRKSMPHYKQCGSLSTRNCKENDSVNRYKGRMRKSMPRIKYRRFLALGKSTLGT